MADPAISPDVGFPFVLILRAIPSNFREFYSRRARDNTGTLRTVNIYCQDNFGKWRDDGKIWMDIMPPFGVLAVRLPGGAYEVWVIKSTNPPETVDYETFAQVFVDRRPDYRYVGGWYGFPPEAAPTPEVPAPRRRQRDYAEERRLRDIRSQATYGMSYNQYAGQQRRMRQLRKYLRDLGAS
jgi:hypothetical protein